MPRIRFITDPKLPRDLMYLGYCMGTEVDLTDDQANRWLRRGVATIVSDAPPEPVAVSPEPVAIPDDWESQHHMARIALARRLTGGDPIETAADADAAITAELDRRTEPA